MSYIEDLFAQKRATENALRDVQQLRKTSQPRLLTKTNQAIVHVPVEFHEQFDKLLADIESFLEAENGAQILVFKQIENLIANSEVVK
jgi:hypothetical protein